MFSFTRLNNHIVVDWPQILAQYRKKAKDPRLRRFYNAAIAEKSMPLSQAGFVALDFETTGLDPDSDDIISIGLVPFDLQRVYCNQVCHWLVNPRKPLEEQAVVVHGITHSALSEAPDLQRVLGEVLEALAGKVIVVHYNRIEREFLDRALVARLGEGIRFPVIDTMAIEATIRQRKRKGFWKRMQGERPLSIRLSCSRERYGLPPYQAHHALIDAIATAELFQAQVAHHYTGGTTLAELWV